MKRKFESERIEYSKSLNSLVTKRLNDDTDNKRNIYAVQYEYRVQGRKKSAYKFILSSASDMFHHEIKNNGVDTVAEVILTNHPCHLYMDIDVNLLKYPDVDVHKNWSLLKEVVTKCLREQIKVPDCVPEYIVLDSSNDVKGSLHIIVKCPDYIFSNNLHCGGFISNLGRYLQFSKDLGEKGSTELLEAYEHIDKGVYTSNRLLRMLGSTKVGQTRYLTSSRPFTFEWWQETHVCDSSDLYEVFVTCVSEPTTTVCSAFFLPPFMTAVIDFLSKTTGFKLQNPTLYNALRMTYHIRTDSRRCPFQKTSHASNVCYIILHILHGSSACWRLKCFSSRCSDRRTSLRYFPPEINDLISSWLSEKISFKMD
jgi:hypothetical protein